MTRIYLQMLIFFVCCSIVHVSADFTASAPNIPLNKLEFVGNGSISATDIVLSLGQPSTSSIVYWKDSQNVLYGFKTAILYETSECDNISYYKGGDGFAFFFASAINTTEQLSTGGTMGLTYKTNVATVGFDMLTNKIVYRATRDAVLGPRAGFTEVIVTGLLSPLRCAPFQTLFQVQYDPPVFTITNNVTGLNTSITMELGDYFDDAPMYVGLSAATGEAFMKQVVTQWEFVGTPPPAVIPFLECYEQLDNSTYVAHMGYQNPTLTPFNLTIGAKNGFNPAPQNRGQPTIFESGRSTYYPLNPFSFQWDGSDVTWTLSSYFVTFNGANTALLCPKSLTVELVFVSYQDVHESQINAILESIANFLEISPSRLVTQNVTVVPSISKRSTMNQEATLELEIGAADSQSQNEPSAAESVQKFVSSASNDTLINEVLNPPGADPDSTVYFVSINPKASGVEGTGSLIVEPPAAPTTPPMSVPVSVPTPSVEPNAVSIANERTVMGLVLVPALMLTYFF